MNPVPLAEKMRPKSLADIYGQKHLVGPGKIIERMIATKQPTSLILWGPPGTGKTTLARIIATQTESDFIELSAVSATKADVKKVSEHATQNKRLATSTILFVDEIHRFNKAQQDVLMPDVEQGNPVLIGATTMNPFFTIVPALLSRSTIFELKPLETGDLIEMMQRALKDAEKGLAKFGAEIDPEALRFLAETSDGDARRALNALEIAVTTSQPRNGVLKIGMIEAEESIQKKFVRYDNQGDEHYDHASAFIKSMRGSDPDAAVYYLAKMLYAGEDPRFIARRLVICASEDVGNADPQALCVAAAALQAAEFVGMPEARINLAQAAVYIACAPKSNASYAAIEKATADIQAGHSLEVPLHLKDGHYKGAKTLGRGVGYQYAHDYEKNYVPQKYLSEERNYYVPTENGYEKKFKDYLNSIRREVK
ncbi:MAG: replication-associated recombination protein A [Candidatus Omnitrophica bacterium]|nr:replication-associated recombination protein A [Candidatus Omnitrophota bacterium]